MHACFQGSMGRVLGCDSSCSLQRPSTGCPDLKLAGTGAHQTCASSSLVPGPEQPRCFPAAGCQLPYTSGAQQLIPGSTAHSQAPTHPNLPNQHPAHNPQRQITTGLAAQDHMQNAGSTASGPLPPGLREHGGAHSQAKYCPCCGAPRAVTLLPEHGQVSHGSAIMLPPEMDHSLAALMPPRPHVPQLPAGRWTHAYHEVLGLMPVVPGCQLCGRTAPQAGTLPPGQWTHEFSQACGVLPNLRSAPPPPLQRAPVQTQQAGQACGGPASQAAAPKLSQIPNIASSTQAAPSGIGPEPSMPSKGKKRKQPRPTVPLFGQLASVPEFWQYWDKGGPLSLGLPVRDLVENLPPGRCRDWKHAAAYLVAFRHGMAPEEAAATEEQIRMAGRIHQTVHFYVKRMARENTEDVQAAAARAAGVVVDWSDSD